MTAVLWPLVALLLGSGALAFAFKWLAQRNEIEALRLELRNSAHSALLKASASEIAALEAKAAAADLDDRLKRLELAQEFRT